MKPIRLLLAAIVCLFLLCSAVGQVTIHVPSERSTVQLAIDSAVNGDTILVAPGTYHERLDFKGKNITVASESGAATTIIDGDSMGTVIRIRDGVTNAATLRGFTITHGKNTNDGSYYNEAGGIEIGGASPTIEGNIITNNQGCTGVGIYSTGGSPIIRNNTISNNRQTTCSGGSGGAGIALFSSGNAQVVGNAITGNIHGSWGGGLCIAYGGTPLVQNNIITKNSGTEGGGILIFNGAVPRMIQNLITDNVGGGVDWLAPSGTNQIILWNNTIANNDRPTASALYASGWDSATLVTNNLLIAKDGQTAVYCDTSYDPGPPQVSFNNVFSNGGATYAGSCGDLTGTRSNISVDPQFANVPAGNYHLSTGSPVLDKADGTLTPLPATDLENNPRVVDGGSGTVKLDLGAYEYQGQTTMDVSPNSLIFGPQRVNTATTSQIVSVKNTGSLPLHLKPAQVGTDFTQTNNCELATGLAPNATCAYAVTFKPKSAGDKSETLVVSGANVPSPVSVGLTGTGAAPVVMLSTTSVSFSNQMMYTTSAPQFVTLTNIGDAVLVVSSTTTTGDYAQTNNCGIVMPNASCTISVTFTPISTNVRSGTITVTDDATGSPRQVSLTGVGLGPEISFNPPHLDFVPQGVGTVSNPQTITVTNTSTYDLVIGQINISADYLQTNNCPATLVSGSACVVTVTFKPSLYGSRPGTLTFTDNAAFSPQAVSLTGTGSAPIAYLSTGSVSFTGQVVVGASSNPATVSYSNRGNDVLAVQNISTSGDFTQANQCPQYLLPQQGCAIQVTFVPTVSGTRTGSLTITDNAYGSPRAVVLQGVAISQYPVPVLNSVSPETVKVGANSTALTITGNNFFPSSKVYWDDQSLTTAYQGMTSLTATVSSSLANSTGEHKVTVMNPAPGGGQSPPLTVAVFISIPISAKDLLFDPYRRVFYATVPGYASTYSNTIATLDPNTGTVVGTPLAIGSDPSALAISEDGQYLYVGLNGASSIKRVNLYTKQVDLEIPLGTDPFFGPYTVLNLAVVPGSPHSVVASLGFTGVSPYEAGVKVFDDALARAKSIQQYEDIDSIVFGSDPSILYGATGGISPASLHRLKLDSSGLTILTDQRDSLGSPIASDQTRIYSGNSAVDAATFNLLGRFSFVSGWATSVYPEPYGNQVYLLESVFDGSGGTSRIWSADKSTFSQTGHLLMAVPNSGIGKLQRWASDGLAYRNFGGSGSGTTNDQVVFVRSSIVNPNTTEVTPAVDVLIPSATVAGSGNFILQVKGSGFQPGARVLWNGVERNTVYVSPSELRAAIPSDDVAQPGTTDVSVLNAGGAQASDKRPFVIGSSLQLSVSSVNFGSQWKNFRSLSRTITLANNTGKSVTINNVVVTGDFAQTNDCGTLAPGSTCELQTYFAPTITGLRSGTLTIFSDAPGAPHGVNLEGTGMDMQVIVTRTGRGVRTSSNNSVHASQAKAMSTGVAQAVSQSFSSSVPLHTQPQSALSPLFIVTTQSLERDGAEIRGVQDEEKPQHRGDSENVAKARRRLEPSSSSSAAALGAPAN